MELRVRWTDHLPKPIRHRLRFWERALREGLAWAWGVADHSGRFLTLLAIAGAASSFALRDYVPWWIVALVFVAAVILALGEGAYLIYRQEKQQLTEHVFRSVASFRRELEAKRDHGNRMLGMLREGDNATIDATETYVKLTWQPAVEDLIGNGWNVFLPIFLDESGQLQIVSDPPTKREIIFNRLERRVNGLNAIIGKVKELEEGVASGLPRKSDE